MATSIEILSEDHRPYATSSEDVLRVSVTSGMLQEIYDFIHQRLQESIGLQRFLDEREKEFLQKYIDCLTDSNNCNSNNQNELEHLRHLEALTSSEKAKKLGEARRRLDEVSNRREVEISDVFSATSGAQIQHLKIMKPFESRLLKNISPGCEEIRKIEKIIEKLAKVGKGLETLFWLNEVVDLMEELEEEQKSQTLAAIIDMMYNSRTSPIRHVYSALIASLLDKNTFNETIFNEFNKVWTSDSLDSEDQVNSVEVISELLEVVPMTDSTNRELFSIQLMEETVKALKHKELNGDQMSSVLNSFEKVGKKFEGMEERLQKIHGLIENKLELLDESQRARAQKLKQSSKSSTTQNSSTTSSGQFTNSTSVVCNVTVAAPVDTATKKELEEMRKQLELLKMEREEENRKRQEEEDRKRREEQEEKNRKEEARRRQEEEERNRRRQEEEARRRREDEERRRQEAENLRLKCTFLNNNPIFWNQDRHQYTASRFDGKVIGLYFSAFWCPPSRTFTQNLRQFHAQTRDIFEVLFVSSDNSLEEMSNYLATEHGNWYYLPFKSPAGESLETSLQVTSLPTLIICKPNGQVITKEGRDLVMRGFNPRELVNSWKALL